jgi:hypothetical protein
VLVNGRSLQDRAPPTGGRPVSPGLQRYPGFSAERFLDYWATARAAEDVRRGKSSAC